MSDRWFDQHPYDLRFDWGPEGLARLAPVSGVVVIVDVLRFTTCVDVAVARRAIIVPYPWADASAVAFAADQGAELAGLREDPGSPWSLSPTDLGSIPAGTRLVLPSPNGSALAVDADRWGESVVLAGCLRNASAVAAVAARKGAQIAVIAAAEQCRPAVEDLLGAGAVLGALAQRGERSPSPEASAAIAAFEAARDHLPDHLAGSASGRELVARGWADDISVAAAFDVSEAAPVLSQGAFAGA